MSREPAPTLRPLRPGRAGRSAWSAVTLLCCPVFLTALTAEDARAAGASPCGSAAEEAIEIDSVTVTARREEEPLNQVPLSASVATPAPATDGPLDAASGAARRAPNYVVADGGRGLRFGIIRGAGLLGYPISPFDTTVGYSLNGQPLSGDAGFSQSIDVARVEVLRGPQNVLFGRSSQAGTINLVTREPDGRRDVRIRAEGGEDGAYATDLTLGGALSTDVAGRLAVRFTGRDGHVPNLGTGNRLGSTRIAAARGSLRIRPGDDIQLTASAFFERDRGRSMSVSLRDDPAGPRSWFDYDPKGNRDLAIGSLELRHAFDTFDLTATLGVQDIREEASIDVTEALLYARFTGLPPAFFTGSAATDFVRGSASERAWSGELRFSAPQGDGWRWIAGAGLYASDVDEDSLQRSSLSRAANGSNLTHLTLTSLSAFAELSIPVSERLTLTPGARVGRDRVRHRNRYDSLGTPGLVASFVERSTFEDTWVTGGLSLDYRLAADGLLYASVRRGHSGGGFASSNGNAPAGVALDPYPSSLSWTWEAGARTTLFRGRADLSAAIFFNDVAKGHVAAFDLFTNRSSIAALDYETYGFETDFRARLGDAWSLTGGLGYSHSALKNVPASRPAGSRNGNALPGAPRWTANLGAEGRWAAAPDGASGDIVVAADLHYVGKRAANIPNTFDLDPYTSINARVAWEGRRISVYAYGRNLLDRLPELTGALIGTVEAVRTGPGRVVGLGVEMRF